MKKRQNGTITVNQSTLRQLLRLAAKFSDIHCCDSDEDEYHLCRDTDRLIKQLDPAFVREMKQAGERRAQLRREKEAELKRLESQHDKAEAAIEKKYANVD